MKILFSSYTFAPNIGGIESVSAILAQKFAEAGHEVTLITQTPQVGTIDLNRPTQNHYAAGGSGEPPLPATYHVVRQPSFWKILRLLFWCDRLFQSNISLRSLIPALLVRKRVIILHQTWLRNHAGGIGWKNRLKRALLPHVTNIAISRAILDHINVLARVIGTPYDDHLFRLMPDVVRDKTLVFLGRLVSDKGVDLLLQAMKILGRDNLFPDLTIIGSGPEEQNLRSLGHELGLDGQLTFVGQKSGDELATLLNQHRILVVPSRWSEPFGVVALEGIACGCVVAGSAEGGLSEAIDYCGLTFQNGDARALALCLKKLLLDPAMDLTFRKAAPGHLARFRADAVASSHLAVIQEI